MRILITNDDGIDAAGIRKLAQIAVKISDEVYIVAPSGQRSAVSHSITVAEALRIRRVPFSVEVKAAYSCSGMPADCVKVAVQAVLDRRPDVVISHEIWNINFPACSPEECRGIRETIPAPFPRYKDVYKVSCVSENEWEYALEDAECEIAGEHTDFYAVEHNYISVGALECSVLRKYEKQI